MPVPDYGLDAPKLVRRVALRGVLLTIFAVIVYAANRTANPGSAAAVGGISGAIGIGFLAVAAIMVWSSRVGKLKLRERILDKCTWRGDESVLDIGCGRGLLLIGAAKRLKNGKAIGVDIWRSEDLSGNSAGAARQNAKVEGVNDRVKIENADARKLPFGANSFDVVLSSLALHGISSMPDREQALREMVRVLKPGGRLSIYDIAHASDCANSFQQAGLAEVELSGVSFLWCRPGRIVTAKKPSGESKKR
jgi:SAM-dependent methyltransferase